MAACVAALLCWAGVAVANPRLVVLPFDGPKAEELRSDVEKTLRRGHDLVDADRWRDTARAMSAAPITTRNVKKVARKLKVDAVITGAIDRRGGTFYLHLRMRSGRSGEIVAQVDVTARRPKLSTGDSGEIRKQLVPAIEEIVSDDGGRGEDLDEEPEGAEEDEATADDPPRAGSRRDQQRRLEAERSAQREAERRAAEAERREAEAERREAEKAREEAARRAERQRREEARRDEDQRRRPTRDDQDDSAEADGAEGDDEEEDDPRARPGSKRGDGDGDSDDDRGDVGDGDDSDDPRVASADDPDDGEAEAEAEATDVAPRGPRDLRTAAVDLTAGVSVSIRRLIFTSTAGLANPPDGYKGSAVPGAFVAAEVYPMALGRSRSPLANLGVRLAFDRVLKIESKVADPANPAMVYTQPTRHSRYGAGIVYRHPIGGSLLLKAAIDYERSEFFVAKGGAPVGVVDVPSVANGMVAPGAGVRFVAGKLAAGLDARYLHILTSGEIDNGDQYGSASVNGFGADVSLDYRIAGPWFARLTGHFATVGYTFDGNGPLANDRDGNPVTPDVGGASDRYFAGYLAAGYLY